MTATEVFLAILSGLSTTWATCSPVAWPNRSYTPPKGVWIEPIIEMGDTLMGEMGADGLAIRFGTLQINVNVMPDDGYKTALGYAARLEAAYKRADMSGVIFDDPATTPVGIVDDYYRAIVRVNFHAWNG